VVLTAALGTMACSDDPDPVPTEPSDCTVTVEPGDNDAENIQEAIDGKIKSGNTLCFAPGTYELDDHIALGAASGVTFRGTGKSRDDVLLDFSSQTSGKEGVLVTTDDFTIENLWVKNTQGNGVQVQGTENATFRNIKVGWDEPADEDNNPLSGGYAIYPTGVTNALIVDSETYGASDAGVYAGQCHNVIVHGNKAHGNVLGIEIENTTGADIYDNEIYDNTTGFLLDLLPHLQKKDAKQYLVHDNHVHDNNRPNFAEHGTVAATAPQGTGVLVLAATQVELTGNQIEDNAGVPVMIVSYDIIDIIGALNGEDPAAPDPTTSRWPEGIYVHANTYENNGTNPLGALLYLAAGPEGEKTIDQYVLWDGILGPDHADDVAAKICLGDPEKGAFMNYHADTSGFDPAKYTTDTTDHQCTLSVPPLEH
jgi:parallel beta-helix repeat protein